MARVIRIPNAAGHQRLKNALALVKAKSAKVGWFESARYENGMPIAYVAAIQEFGYAAGGIPPRSFMRTTAAEKGRPGGEWSVFAERGARAVLAGNSPPEFMMDMIGQKASGDIAKKIASITTPPLKASTVRARERRYARPQKHSKLEMSFGGAVGFGIFKPLVDTGQMVNSVTYVVEG